MYMGAIAKMGKEAWTVCKFGQFADLIKGDLAKKRVRCFGGGEMGDVRKLGGP